MTSTLQCPAASYLHRCVRWHHKHTSGSQDVVSSNIGYQSLLCRVKAGGSLFRTNVYEVSLHAGNTWRTHRTALAHRWVWNPGRLHQDTQLWKVRKVCGISARNSEIPPGLRAVLRPGRLEDGCRGRPPDPASTARWGRCRRSPACCCWVRCHPGWCGSGHLESRHALVIRAK